MRSDRDENKNQEFCPTTEKMTQGQSGEDRSEEKSGGMRGVTYPVGRSEGSQYE